MKKPRLNLNFKNILRLMYISLLLVNFIVIFYLYGFIIENVRLPIYIKENDLMLEAKIMQGKINQNKFENVVDSFNNKKKLRPVSGIKNIFD